MTVEAEIVITPLRGNKKDNNIALKELDGTLKRFPSSFIGCSIK